MSLRSPLIVVSDTTLYFLAYSLNGLHATAGTSNRCYAKLREHHESCTLRGLPVSSVATLLDGVHAAASNK